MSDVMMLRSSLLVTDVEVPYGNVIDIEGSSTTERTALDAFTPTVSAASLAGTTTFAANQTWEIDQDPAGSSHHVIKNPATGFCIDIRDGAQTPGAVLQTYPKKSSDNANQLWDFLPDPFGSGACFIQNPQTGLVIEVKDGSNRAGTALVLGRRRLFDNNAQLWTGLLPSPGIADGTDLAAARLPALTLQTPPTLTVQAPPPQFGGNTQYVFLAPSQNEPFTSLSVTLDVIEDLVAEAFMVQINGNAPAPAQNANDPVSPTNDAGSKWDAQWLQYGLEWNNNQFSLWNQFWHKAGPEPTNRLPSQPGSASVTKSPSGSALTFTDNTIPAGIQIVLKLTVDGTQGNRVTAIGASVYQNGTLIGSGSLQGPGQQSDHAGVGPVQESDLAPFGSFQVVVAGDPNAGGANNFTAGMGTITINCQPACTLSTGPGGIDPLFGLQTAEDTNCYYGELPEGSSGQLVQPFGVTRPRVTGVSGQSVLSGAGLYPNSALHVSGHFTFNATNDTVPIEVVPGSAAADGSFAFALGCHWASGNQAAANDNGAATANVDVKVTDSQGNSVTAKLLTGVAKPQVLSSSGSVGGFPGIPTGINASRVQGSDTAALVSFTAPESDGGLPITGYQVSANPSQAGAAPSLTGTRSPVKVGGLTSGDAYTFTVAAINAFGAGIESASSNAITT
jgi:hypothetical protein